MFLAQTAEIEIDATQRMITTIVIFLGVFTAVMIGTKPFLHILRKREKEFGLVLGRTLLLEIPPRMITILTGAMMFAVGFMAYMILAGSLMAAIIAAGLMVPLPGVMIHYLRRKRLRKLEEQLVGGIQTLSSGVRAGLNLPQAMERIVQDSAAPLRQEFAHMIREYEYGVPLDEAMNNAADRIGSGDYRLLFAALHTHRRRGGNLGETLDRIAESIREIQRLENRVESLTAQGRATARWLGAMPAVVMGIYYFIDPPGVVQMFTTNVGKSLLIVIIILNLIGFLWIRKIMSIDI